MIRVGRMWTRVSCLCWKRTSLNSKLVHIRDLQVSRHMALSPWLCPLHLRVKTPVSTRQKVYPFTVSGTSSLRKDYNAGMHTTGFSMKCLMLGYGPRHISDNMGTPMTYTSGHFKDVSSVNEIDHGSVLDQTQLWAIIAEPWWCRNGM